MTVLERTVYRGPHLFDVRPMIRIQLDLGALEDAPSNLIPGFADELVALLPGLKAHACSRGKAGGLVERLTEGTWLGHVAEHVAIELQTLIGERSVARGKTRAVQSKRGAYNILFEYEDEKVGLLAGRFALELVDRLLPEALRGLKGAEIVFPLAEPAQDLPSMLQALLRLRGEVGLGPSTRALVDEARQRGIPVMRLDDRSLVQFGWGAQQRSIRASITSRTPFIAVDTASNKDLTKRLLRQAAIPVPEGTVIRTADQAVAAAETLGGPVVVKPLDANHGRGVSTNLTEEGAVRAAFDCAARFGPRVIVEQYCRGDDCRLLVVDGEVVAAALRRPASVVGDGCSTVRALIDQVNLDPCRGAGHEQVMTRIKLDDRTIAFLAAQNLSPEAVPEAGQLVPLAQTANLSTGGTAVDVTDLVHPDNICFAARAALTLGLDVAGIDLISPDISKSLRETGGGVIEVNAAPGLRMHLRPSQGRPRNVAKPILDSLFKEGGDGRIPIYAITGTNGKSTTARMLAHILRHSGKRVGLTTTSGVYINGQQLMKADASGPRSARIVLRDAMVDVAVLEIARGGLLREGLAFDRCDAGVVTNIAADHLGLKGVDTLEDLAWVKQVVVESVAASGVSVLNADDVHCLAMRRRAGGRLAYFSLAGGSNMPDHLRDHIDGGGLAVVHEPHTGLLAVYDDGRRHVLIRTADIPATLGGAALFNVQNALAAACVAIGAGHSPAQTGLALSTFGASFEQNPGRLNIYDGHGFRVIMDYAHNPAGLRALSHLLARLRPSFGRQIGMVAVPGDRRDEDIVAMGEIAALTYDEVVLREDADRRGRAAGEVIKLMALGAARAGMAPERVHAVPDEMEAVTHCLNLAGPGDLVLLNPTKVDEMWAAMLSYSPAPTARPIEEPDGLAVERAPPEVRAHA